MKNKNITYGKYVNDYQTYGNYIDISDYMKEYNGYWTENNYYETEEERLARKKMEMRNAKIEQILG